MHPLLPRLGASNRPAIRLGGQTVSYAELERRARAHASRLRADGVVEGDRVAVWATPELGTAAAVVGNALAGIATIPLNPAIGEGELAHVLADASPRLVLAASPELFSTRTPGVQAIAVDGPTAGALAEPAPGDPLLVLYTSGTTGPPKGAILTQHNAAFDVDALAEAWGWTADDVLVHALPLFHVHGLVLGLLGTFRVGATVQLLPRFTPDAVCAAMERGTLLFAVPTMYHRLTEHAEAVPADARRLARARLLVSGSAPLPVRENDRIWRLFGQRVVERYGLTETLIVCAARHDGPRTPGTVGPPLRGLDLRLVDDERRPLPPGPDVLGEVAVRGPTVFAGYLNRPDATRAAMDDEGFFHTGDVASITAGGEVRIVGRRATDLIKTGGYKVGAGEVEDALLEHPAVREAAVVGVADEDLGERIAAFVVVAEGAAPAPEELAEHVAQRLAPHKRPRIVRILPTLPRNAMGKVLKKELAGLL
jgi:malonyl-CoA/methylmalonyl-CoA synthetase